MILSVETNINIDKYIFESVTSIVKHVVFTIVLKGVKNILKSSVY